MGTPTLKSNAGDQRVCKKKNLSWLFCADIKIRPSGSLFGITRHSLVMPNSDPLMDFFYPHLTPIKDSYILVIKIKCFIDTIIILVLYYSKLLVNCNSLHALSRGFHMKTSRAAAYPIVDGGHEVMSDITNPSEPVTSACSIVPR